MSPPHYRTRWLRATALSAAAFAAALTLYAVPATLTLTPGIRPGLEPMSLDDAAALLRTGGAQGWELVEAARGLVADRMQYSRRNSFDPAPRAFARGYGYCQQMAFALTSLLRRLGFEARVVQALRNDLPDGRVSGHAWVRVRYGGATRDVDALLWDPETGQLTFQPLTRITGMRLPFRLFSGWGCTAANAHRYYRTRSDEA